jgi:hypothetical protein
MYIKFAAFLRTAVNVKRLKRCEDIQVSLVSVLQLHGSSTALRLTVVCSRSQLPLRLYGSGSGSTVYISTTGSGSCVFTDSTAHHSSTAKRLYTYILLALQSTATDEIIVTAGAYT